MYMSQYSDVFEPLGAEHPNPFDEAHLESLHTLAESSFTVLKIRRVRGMAVIRGYQAFRKEKID